MSFVASGVELHTGQDGRVAGSPLECSVSGAFAKIDCSEDFSGVRDTANVHHGGDEYIGGYDTS